MIQREEILKVKPTFDFNFIGPPDRMIFFDIETTGLMRKDAFIYLVGVVLYEFQNWKMYQFFAESPNEERDILGKFAEFIKEKRKSGRVILISFNGDGFDIPFIREALRKNEISDTAVFSNTISLDLLKSVRPLKKLLGLVNCKLKTVEKLFGINREDKYNGGELIYVYQEYLRLQGMPTGNLEDNDLNRKLKESLLETLLLHNAEDISDMPFLMGIYAYEELKKGEFEITKNGISSYDSISGPRKVWDINARLSIPVPKGLYFERNGMVLSIGEEDPSLINMTAEVFEGELKYFYTDYKNYYYLPAEDMAVHKSVGQYVDKSMRKQATKATCYQRKMGLFIPEAEPVIVPVFYKDETKKQQYGLLEKIFESKTHESTNIIAKRYILSALKQMSEERTDNFSSYKS